MDDGHVDGRTLTDPLADHAAGGERQQALHDLEGPAAGLGPGIQPDLDAQLHHAEQVIGHYRRQQQQ